MRSKLSAVLAALFFPVLLHAAPAPVEGLYGPEFTFTDSGSVTAEQKTLYINHLRNHLVHNQPEGAKFTETGGDKFTSPNGWWFQVTTNPGVLEIKMSPLSVADTRRFKDDIQDAIFVSAANVALFPWDYLGGGHINFDYRIFAGNVLLARNFVVDFWNHNELSMGILSFDTNNALPPALYKEEVIEKLHAVIAKADAGYFNEDGVPAFLRELNLVLVSGENRLNAQTARNKYHDLNFAAGRVEIRAVRPQANMDIWLNQIELIENRINNHLRFIRKPLPFNFRVPVDYSFVAKNIENDQLYLPPIDPQAALKSFYEYVQQARLNWNDHRAYVWPPWFREGELQKFEESKVFKNLERRQSQKRCARALESRGL